MTDVFDRMRATWLQCLGERVEAGRVEMDEASRIYEKICATLEMEKRNHEKRFTLTKYPPLGQKQEVFGRHGDQVRTAYRAGGDRTLSPIVRGASFLVSNA